MLNYIRIISIASTVALCLTIAFAIDIQADELSAEEIMAKSQIAMSQPIRYTSVSADGSEMDVYRKSLPDGLTAMLTNSLSTKSISITYGKKNYRIFLEHQIAIDMSNIRQNVSNKAASLNSGMEDVIHKKSYKIVGIVMHKNKDCYEIQETVTPEFKKAVWDKIPDNMRDQFPAKCRFLIDKENFLVQVRETLTESGTTLSKMEYTDIRPQPDLSDDFFQLPPGLEVLSPQSNEEYIAILADKLSEQRSLVDRDAEFERIKTEIEEKYPILPRRDVRKESEELIQQFRERVKTAKEDLIPPKEYPLPKPSSRWITPVVVNGIVFTLLLILWWIRRKRKS